jgi:hypothetical protein
MESFRYPAHSARILSLVSALALTALPTQAQFQNQDETPYVGWTSSTGDNFSETTLFEARPRLQFDLLSRPDITSSMRNGEKCLHQIGLVFDPHIRMFTTSSVPVRMPSYRIYPSYSHTHIWLPEGKAGTAHHFTTSTLDHGHYSNGQEGCAFDANATHETPACDSVYAAAGALDGPGAIHLQERLNRRSGEFSTDFIRIKFKHLWVSEYGDQPYPRCAWEFSGSYMRLVDRWFGFDVGGYSTPDTRFYPMNQFGLEAAHRWTRQESETWCLRLYQARTGVEGWFKPSRSQQVHAWNFALFGNVFWDSGVGLGLKFETGQDAYNVRLVDRIHRVLFAIVLQTDRESIERGAAP